MVNPRAWLAEAIGTFSLIFFGTLSITLAAVAFGGTDNIAALVMISLAHASIVGIMVYTFGHISGAHINPAVTIPQVLTKKLNLKDGIGYISFQIIGAIIGALAHKAILPQGIEVHFGTQTGPSQLLNFNPISGTIVELIFTFFLVTVIFMAAIHKKAISSLAGISIGGIIFLLHLVGIPLTGASINPARTFGPALVSGFWDYHWIYWIGPIMGGIIAGVIMNYIFFRKEDKIVGEEAEELQDK